jgi:secreted trypsin-like serine protease
MTRLNVLKCGWTIAMLTLTLTFWIPPTSAITWGEPDSDGHPNVGAMVAMHPELGPREICSGTLIAPQVFLTAGHCTDWASAVLPPGLLHVSFSTDDALNPATWLPVAAIITHPDYNWGPYSDPHDVGILILEEPVILPAATLPGEGFLDELRADGMLRQGREGAKFTVVGYGSTLEWPPPKIIPPDGVRRVAQSEFLNLQKAWLLMSQNHAPGRGDAGTSYGDSGGPTFWVEQDGSEILVSVTSWGDIPCVATGTTYRIDIPDSLDFINSVLGVRSAPPRDANRLTAALWGRIKSDY